MLTVGVRYNHESKELDADLNCRSPTLVHDAACRSIELRLPAASSRACIDGTNAARRAARQLDEPRLQPGHQPDRRTAPWTGPTARRKSGAARPRSPITSPTTSCSMAATRAATRRAASTSTVRASRGLFAESIQPRCSVLTTLAARVRSGIHRRLRTRRQVDDPRRLDDAERGGCSTSRSTTTS